jgi:hypothetical protein
MADTVQVLMERMIPELEDLQEKKLFSAVRLCFRPFFFFSLLPNRSWAPCYVG